MHLEQDQRAIQPMSYNSFTVYLLNQHPVDGKLPLTIYSNGQLHVHVLDSNASEMSIHACLLLTLEQPRSLDEGVQSRKIENLRYSRAWVQILSYISLNATESLQGLAGNRKNQKTPHKMNTILKKYDHIRLWHHTLYGCQHFTSQHTCAVITHARSTRCLASVLSPPSGHGLQGDDCSGFLRDRGRRGNYTNKYQRSSSCSLGVLCPLSCLVRVS